MSAICIKCQCGCLILSYNCLHGVHSKLKQICIEDKPELLNNVNNFVLMGTNEETSVLGYECFMDLCSDIKMSQKMADNYNEDYVEGEGNKKKTHLDYMQDKWLRLINNQLFQNMYAYYILHYYYSSGDAIGVSSSQGEKLVTDSGGSDMKQTGTKTIDIASWKIKATNAKNLAANYKAQVMTHIIKKYPNDYCQLNDKCSCGKRSCKDCSGLKKAPDRRRPKTVSI